MDFITYLLKDIPAKLHAEMKESAKSQRISIRQWILSAIEDKLNGCK